MSSHMKAPINRRSVLTYGACALVSAGARSLAQAGRTTMPTSIRGACAAYLKAWARKDLDALGPLLHAEVHFKSPTAETTGRDKFLAATARFFPLIERVDTRAQFIGGDS